VVPAPAPDGPSTQIAAIAVPTPDDTAASAPPAVSEQIDTAPAAVPASAAAAASPDGLTLRAVQATWVQVIDGNGQTLMERLVPAGELVALNAAPPVRLRIGNASGAELTFRGQPVDLKTAARNNIANLTLP